MKILIISPGIYPVPATKGGAVENLIQMLIYAITIYKNLDQII